MKKDTAFILNILSTALMAFGLVMLPSVLISVRYGDTTIASWMLLIAGFASTIGLYGKRELQDQTTLVSSRISFITITLTWTVMLFLGALPFYFSGLGYSFIDSLFESAAGLTTTGASTLRVYYMPAGLQLWRASMNWVGGIGIIILTISLIPNWQFAGRHLMRIEAPGPGFIKSETTFRKGFRFILGFYCSMTLLHFIALRIAGMSEFSAFLTALSGISTAGMAHFAPGVLMSMSAPIKAVISVFAFLASMNFSMFVLLITKRFRVAKHGTEMKLHFVEAILTALLVCVTLVISTGHLVGLKTFGSALAQVISFISTSGYVISDTSNWTYLAKVVIFIEVFIGACAVSTGGGIKIARTVLAFKTAKYSLYRHIHPSSIKPIRFTGRIINSTTVLRANLYVAVFFAIYLVGVLSLCIDTDMSSALSYAQAMITNTGTSIFTLDHVDPGTLQGFSSFNKAVMIYLMLAGRLEIYPLLVLFSRSFWRKDRKAGE